MSQLTSQGRRCWKENFEKRIETDLNKKLRPLLKRIHGLETMNCPLNEAFELHAKNLENLISDSLAVACENDC